MNILISFLSVLNIPLEQESFQLIDNNFVNPYSLDNVLPNIENKEDKIIEDYSINYCLLVCMSFKVCILLIIIYFIYK